MKILQHKPLEQLLFVDIESRRLVEQLEEGTPLHESWLYKQRYSSETEKFGDKRPEQTFLDKGSLYSEFSCPVCITVGRFSEGTFKMKSYCSANEVEILEGFSKDLSTFQSKSTAPITFVGFGIKGFDLPYMVRRYIINQIPLPDTLQLAGLKPWEQNHIDLLELWRGGGWTSSSLLNVAVALGLPSPKNKMDGSGVSDAFFEGRLDEVREYCERDVETTFQIFKKMAYIK